MVISKEKIKKVFLKVSPYYDKYAFIQREAAHFLLKEIENFSPRTILEIGAGTGIYTELLKNKFPASKIYALDISRAMLAVAEEKINSNNIFFLSADAEVLDKKFLPHKYHLITSNLCFQWFSCLDKALKKYRTFLKEQGGIYFSIFGPDTFYELGCILKDIFPDYKLMARNFPSQEILLSLLKKNFSSVFVKEKIIQKQYSSLKEFLTYIKYTSPTPADNLWTKKRLLWAEELYLKKFTKIIASYQVFYCGGKNGNSFYCRN